jgi:hypothetical protein
MIGAMTSNLPVSAPVPLLRRFVRRANLRYRRAAFVHAALRTGLPGACGVVLLLWWSLAASLWCAAAVAVAVLIDVAATASLLRRRGHAALAGIGGRAFADELRTWVERDAVGAAGSAMASWLADDLANAIDVAPARSLRPPRRAITWLRYFVPILVVLLLAHWLLPDLSVPTPGLLGGGHRPQGGQGPGGGSDEQGRSGGAPEKPGSAPPLPKPPPTPDPEPPPPPPPAVPAPMLDLPSLPTAVVPQFIGDGASRRALAQVALLPAGGNGSASDAQRGGDAVAAPSPPPAVQFAAAAERALQSRHVPPEEQAVVKRYFALLKQESK